MQITFMGHASFHVKAADVQILIDPWINDNPASPPGAKDLKGDYIFVTHAHFDHVADVATIASAQGSKVITTNEVAADLSSKGVDAVGMHIGGKDPLPFGSVKVVNAFHGSGIAGGHAVGFIIEVEGKKLYHAGDTGLYGDMKLISELWGPIEVAMLPIGSHFTMDAEDAAHAARWIEAKTVIPMHYDTFPPIKADPEAFKRKVESEGKSRVVILKPGDTLTV